ncbi:DUF5685 family protein [uncultured Oscillibacter sp.]|jgi:hypothetical protein|uniref:DUF5685 family protein n=1 Tax=uncultured Oscillibacter sp. TaxID=876091 RepID=UPI00216CEF1A|nr:DUF5685 family protein [uncultured Oscillibacter sp.]MCI9553713.1 hypothetical protein [Oscillibacter sp.]
MFGYVRLPQDLPEEERNRFGRAYCGLCHTLGTRYGPAARFILNYDFTFLAILLSEKEEGPIHHGRCAAHPVHGRDRLESSPALDLAADESVILAYWQARDGVEDHDWLHGLKYRAVSAVLEPAYRKAAALRPDFDESTRRQLRLLAELEGEHCPSIDRAADTFAILLRGAAQSVDEPVRRRVLEQIFYHLGRWVYLVDAADDLKKDAASGNYNPVALRYGLLEGVWTEESRTGFAATLDHSIHMMATAFELWDFGVWTPVLKSTLYTGLFRVGKAVLDGTFHGQGKKRDTQESST